MKILIAEDDEDSRVYLKRALSLHGHEVVAVENGLEALEAARESPPDMIISDILMPEMDGFQLCRKVKEEASLKETPVIFYTATYTDERDMNLAKAIGVSRYLLKPMDFSELHEAMNEVFEEQKERRRPAPTPIPHDRKEVDELNLLVISKKLDTKVRELEEALKASELAYTAALRAQRMEAVGHLTGGVAHDFNNLLGIIMGNLDLLSEELPEEGGARERVSKIAAAAERGATLVQGLLAFARKQALQPKSIDINALVSEVDYLLRHILMEHIDIEVKAGSDLWACVADPVQVETVLVNLAINARDAMPEGGSLRIETANVVLNEEYAAANAYVRPGEYVMLMVTDNGVGMTPEVQERMFDPFFTTKDVGEGTGLGLSMVYGFVKQSGGHVSVDSEEGQGTTLKIFLPRSGQDEQASKIEVHSQRQAAGNGQSILVVDDDVDIRELTKTLLEDLGYAVSGTGTGSAALDILAKSKMDLLLTDMNLPGGMTGRELVKQSRSLDPTMKTLFMSGYSESGIRDDESLEKSVGFLQKPFRKMDLAQKVFEALDHKLDG